MATANVCTSRYYGSRYYGGWGYFDGVLRLQIEVETGSVDFLVSRYGRLLCGVVGLLVMGLVLYNLEYYPRTWFDEGWHLQVARHLARTGEYRFGPAIGPTVFYPVAWAFRLFGIGLLGLIFRRDLVVKLLALGLVNGSVILCLVSLNAQPDGVAPIVRSPGSAPYVDPLPQALVLSAIVINFAVLALALVFVMLLVERYHTTDSQRIEHEITREEEER